jgi:phytoene desaturase
MPDLFEDFFKEFGYEVDDLFELKKLSPSYRIFFKDSGKQIDVFDEVEKNRDTFEAIEPGSTDNLKKYLKKAKYQYEVAMKDFVPKNYDSITDFFTWRMLTEGIKLNVFSTIGTYVKRYFKTPEMQKIIQYPMVFL